MLTADEEADLAKRWREHGDLKAGDKLVTSHLRLAASIALRYRGYGLPAADLVAEANLGLMEALQRFDPERGARFATYATWWIRTYVLEYILNRRGGGAKEAVLPAARRKGATGAHR